MRALTGSVPVDAPYSTGCLQSCQSPAGRKSAEQRLSSPMLAEGLVCGSVPVKREEMMEL